MNLSNKLLATLYVFRICNKKAKAKSQDDDDEQKEACYISPVFLT